MNLDGIRSTNLYQEKRTKEAIMVRRLVGLSVMLVAVAFLSPAQSASLINNAVRISPALQFHSVSPDLVRFPDKHALGDITVTKPTDKGTSKVMTRKHSLSDFHITKHVDTATPKLMTRKHSLSDLHVTKHVDKSSPKLMLRTEPTPPTSPVPIPYPNSAQQ